MKRFLFTASCFLFCAIITLADNNVYWVSFTDKANNTYTATSPEAFLSDRAIQRRSKLNIAIEENDLPVSDTYIDSLNTLGFTTYKPSKWLNGIMIEGDHVESFIFPSFVESIRLIKESNNVKSTIQKNKINTRNNSVFSLGITDTQISIHNGQALHEKATADGIHIALLDGGYYNADTDRFFDQLRDRGGILGTLDLVKSSETIYSDPSDYHGAYVLSTMAGYLEDEYMGTAPDASYWLIRSEDGNSEYPIEEYNWVIAAEFADSVGVDIINSSLGYYEFDNSDMDYTYNDMDGETCISSKGANIAFSKGIVVVTSAGNEGNNPWYYVIAPSEAKHVVSVGAIKADSTLAYFSSRGFETGNHELKPNIVALGYSAATTNTNGEVTYANGTSFSSPIACGFIACLIELYPTKTPQEIVDLTYSISNRYTQHSTLYGYGIPNFMKLIEVANDELYFDQVKCYPNPFNKIIHLENVSGFDQLNVISVTGTKVYTEAIKGRSSINITFPENIGTGNYLVTVSGKNGTKTFKITLQ